MSNRFLLVALAALVFASSAPAADAPGKRPNIVIIVADDQGYGDLGVQGGKDIPTPNIDSIAKNGTRFTSGYVSGPYCSPTRAGLLTGRYQTRFGHEFNPGPAAVPGKVIGLPLGEQTLADKLKAAGYATGLVGKWHLGYEEAYHPLKRGFEHYFGFLGGAHPYLKWDTGKQPILKGTEPVVEQTYLTDAFGREAAAYVETHAKKEKPFFLLLTFNAVHTPMESTPKYLERFKSIEDEKRRTYAAMTSAMDDAIGHVLGKLKETGIEEETLIAYISDNGGPKVNGSNNGALRGQKAQTLEGGIRIPYFIQWRGRLPAGKTDDRPVIQLDLHATALAAAGVDAGTGSRKLDGVNLLPYLEGQKSEAPHEALYWRFGKQTAVRAGDWKLVKHAQSTGAELYNLAKDIGESNDLAAKEPERVKELQALWDKWNEGNVPAAWGGPGAKAGAGADAAPLKGKAKRKAARQQPANPGAAIDEAE